MKDGLRHYLLAVQFFTRVPVTGRLADWVGYSPQRLRASAAHFPGVGWLVGGVVASAWWLVIGWLGVGHLPDTAGAGAAPMVAAVMSTIAGVLLTGGFHEDGLADVADGLGGAVDRDRALAIMKDSRLGTYGVLALVLALALKISLLVMLTARGLEAMLMILLAAHVMSRWVPLFVIFGLPHIEAPGTSSKSKPLADAISPRSLLVATLWTTPALIGLLMVGGGKDLLACLAVCVLVGLMLGRWFLRRLGGFTGDCLGAVQQVTELAIYLALARAPPTFFGI